MKSSIRIFNVLFLTAIYCIATGVFTKASADLDFNNSSTSSHKKYISDLSTTLIYYTTSTESSVTNFNNLPTPGFKNSFTGYWGIVKASEQLFETAFSQHTSFSINLLINNRKANTLFPFHYFW